MDTREGTHGLSLSKVRFISQNIKMLFPKVKKYT